MVSVTSLLALAYVGCGLVPLALVGSVRRHADKPGSTGLLVALIGLSIWSVAYGLAITAASPGTVLALGSLVLVGGQLAAVGYLFLALEYTDTAALTSRLVAGVTVVIVTVQLLALTDPIHRRLWGETTRPIIDAAAAEPPARVLVGAILFVAVVAALVLLADIRSGNTARRRQCLALVAAGVPTVVITFVDVFVVEAVVISLLPFGVTISVFTIAWALFRADLLEVAPIGRRRIVEEMSDAAVVLDADDRVIECNPAARALVDADPDYAGTSLEQFFGTVPAAVDQLRARRELNTEISVDATDERRDLHLRASLLDDSRAGVTAGRLVVLRDITPLKRRERALERRESELEFVSQLLTRVLRHDLRNELSVVRGYAAIIADDGDPSVSPIAEAIVETSDDLLATSRTARTIQRIIDREDAEHLDLAARLEELVTSHRPTGPTTTLSLTRPERCPVETDPGLEYAVDILLETALAHGDDTHATIDVYLECADDDATITVIDRAACLPQTELAVFAESDPQLLEQTNEIGLWIVHWIVDRSSATITVDTGLEENRVSIRVPTSSETDGR